MKSFYFFAWVNFVAFQNKHDSRQMFDKWQNNVPYSLLARVVQRVDWGAIHWINHYAADK